VTFQFARADLAHGLRDRPLAFVAGVQVRQCGAGRGVAHALHQLAQPGARACRQHVPGMTQIMKVDQRQLSRPERREPDPLPEVGVPQRRTLRAREDQPVSIYAACAPDVLPDDRHDHCRYDDHALASIGLGWRETEPTATQLDQLPRNADRLRGQVNVGVTKCCQLTPAQAAENCEQLTGRLIPWVFGG
jgi:hypothetical protein